MRFDRTISFVALPCLVLAAACATSEDTGSTSPPEPTGPVTLAGSSWMVSEYDDGAGTLVDVIEGTTVQVSFDEKGTVGGSAGCNNFSAIFETEDGAMAVGHTAVTRKMCADEGVMKQEAAFLDALSNATTWAIEGDRLRLGNDEGGTVVDLATAPQTADHD